MKGVRELIENAGAQLRYLPPYSPDFNPLEKIWSKIKAILKKLKCRSEKRLFDGIREAFLQVSKSDALGWFNSSGYCLQLWKRYISPKRRVTFSLNNYGVILSQNNNTLTQWT